MTVARRAGAGFEFWPEGSYLSAEACPGRGQKPADPKMKQPDPDCRSDLHPAYPSAENLLQILFKKIDYLARSAEIQRA